MAMDSLHRKYTQTYILRLLKVSKSHPTQTELAMQANQVQLIDGQPRALWKMQDRRTPTVSEHTALPTTHMASSIDQLPRLTPLVDESSTQP
jgi:hypothetical protein